MTNLDALEVERFMSAHHITQVTAIPPVVLDGREHGAMWSAVIGNNHYFGDSLADIVRLTDAVAA